MSICFYRGNCLGCLNVSYATDRTNNPNLATPLRKQREDYWIPDLGTATPYACIDKSDSICILSSPTCISVNVMGIFKSAPRRKRSHGHRYYTSPIFHDVSLNDLLTFMQKPLGMHHIRSKLFSLPLSKLHTLYNSCLVSNVINPNSNEYKLTAIVLDNADHRLFKPVGIKKVEIDKRSFLKLSFANRYLDCINLGNILHHKSVKSKIPPYYKDQSVPIISYVYTRPITPKKIIYKHVLHDLNNDDFKSKPPDCTCASSPFVYNPTGNVITGDLKIINNTPQPRSQ